MTTAELAALRRSPLPVALLVEMDLSMPVYMNTGSINLTVGPTVYWGTRGLGRIEEIQESVTEIKQLRFEMSGVPSESIALALGEVVQGKPVRIKMCLFDPDTYAVLSSRIRWAGRLDVFSIEDGPDTSTLRCTAEHAGIDLLRPLTSLFSNAEQQRLYPGDPSLQYMSDQAEQKVVWPAASFGKV